MGKPLVSIIVPVYQVNKYIERCLHSVMQQQGDFSIECILVDDCSPDDSMAKAERLIANYEGQIVFHTTRHEQNMGLSAARNTGMSLATGDYLLFVDSDDYITADCVKKLTNVIRKYPEVQIVKGNHEGRGKMNVARIPLKLLDNYNLLELLYMGVIPVMAWNTLIKRSLIEQLNLSFIKGMIYEDNLWSVQLFRHTDSFAVVEDITYYYESNPSSIQGDGDVVFCQPKYLPYKIRIVDELLNSFDSSHFAPYACYVVSQLMLIFDCMAKDGHLDDETSKRVLKLRNSLMKHTLSHCRIVLVVYELLLYSPFRCLMGCRWFRHHYNRIEKVICGLAKLLDCLHKPVNHISKKI